MAVFDESKVINALHTDKAEIGKEYFCSDEISRLKGHVENNHLDTVCKIIKINNTDFPFCANENDWALLYPYEEPKKELMTNRQLAEWLAKGNGQYRLACGMYDPCMGYTYECGEDDYKFDEGDDITIRSWGSEEWVEPTIDVYIRDCKGENK